jgi:recombination protein RecT
MSTDLATRKLQTLAGILEQKKGSLSTVVARGLSAERLIKIAVAAASRSPQLIECDPVTVYRSLSEAAQLGLEAGSPLGHAYLVPFKNNKSGRMECQFILGYRGMIDLARRSGQILSIEARVVYDGDVFDHEFGLDPKCKHVPRALELDDSKITHAYAVAKLAGGGVQFEVLTKAQIDAVRAKSKAGKFGPWVDHYPEMAKKTAIRRLFKYLPISIELADQIQREDEVETHGATVDVSFAESDGEPPADPAQTQTEKIKATLDAAKQVEA